MRIESLLPILFLLSNLSFPTQAQLDSESDGDLKLDVLSIDIREIKQREYSIPVGRLSPDNRSIWMRITCEYRISKEQTPKEGVYSQNKISWIDDCIFSWRVILARSSVRDGPAEAAQSILLGKDITYRNIEVSDKRKHYAVVYIEPSVLRRYGNLMTKKGILVHLVVKADGKLLANTWATPDDTKTSVKAPAGLFSSSRQGDWFGSEKLTRLEYGLLSRFETPWAWSSYGSYELIIR